MADNTTTREDNAKKIERKEKPQQLAHKLAGDIFYIGSSSGKMLDKEDQKEEPLRAERSLQVYAKSPMCWKLTL